MIGGIVFLTILPVLAYPLQKYIPGFKDKGREGQRSLAMIFSFAGYLLGTVVAFAFSANTIVKIIYLEYLFCGITMLVFNKLFKLKAERSCVRCHRTDASDDIFQALHCRSSMRIVCNSCIHCKCAYEETHANAASWWSFDTACDAYNCGFNFLTLGVIQ